MSAFLDLFASRFSRPGAGADPTWADRQFPALVERSPLRLWRPGDPISSEGLRVLVGAATWSGYDMRLLDVMAEALGRGTAEPDVVEVFNVADCLEPNDFRKYIPEIQRLVLQPPVAGLWSHGQLDWWGEGFEARDRVARLFGSGSAEIVAFIDEWRKARTPA